ncbi:MAG: DUF2800 domain-containing protein [Bacteroidales bacterium]|nr:DUF2800 domain-containing protein [Bacteroidales bacterium]
MVEEQRNHAILSASSAHRWLVCTPSARLEQEEGREECSVFAAEGTAAHALAELKLKYRFGKIPLSEYQEEYEAFKVDPEFSKYYNKEFEEYVDDHVEYVISVTENLTNYHIFFEVRVNFANVVPQGFGTADVLIVTEDTIWVIDLKFGAGVPVSAINNPQLRLYGMGALNLFPNSKYIKMTINQPRLASRDTEELTKKELLDWSFNYVAPRAEEAIKGEGTLHSTEDACRFCKLRGKCKERADTQLAIARREFEIVDQKQTLVQNLSVEQLSNILEIAPLFIDWFKDVQSFALGQLMQGVKIPGYKLVEGRSNRIITDEDKVKEILLGVGLTEDDIMKPREMYGISKLESIVGKKLFAELCKEYLVKPAGKLTLAPDGDRRPEVTTLAIAQSEFASPIE